MIIDWCNDNVPPAIVRDADGREMEVSIAACNPTTGWIRSFVHDIHGVVVGIPGVGVVFYEFYVPEPLKIEWVDREVGWKWFEKKVMECEEEQQLGEGEG